MEPEKKVNGAFVGLIIIIIILVLGGIYIWMSNKTPEITSQADTITSQDSAELSALEQDSATTNTSSGVDAGTVY